MKKIILTCALLVFVAVASAENQDKRPSVSGFVSNGFWSNWEISAGAGVGTAFSSGANLGVRRDRIGFEGNISLTKWIHPIVGLRGQLQGGRFNNFDPKYGQQKWPYMFLHADLMVNVSNWFGGYRADRAYYAVPFVGFGYMVSNFSDKSQQDNHSGSHQNFAAAFGLLNKFRISPAVDFNLEFKGLVTSSRIAPAQLDGAYLMGLSATAGFTYRFNQRDWQRGCPGYSAADIQAFQQSVAQGNAALAEANAENVRLSEALKAAEVAAAEAAEAAAAAKAAAEKVAPVVEKTKDLPSIILYEIGKTGLTSQEKTRLELIAEDVKNGPADRVYTIQGHADKQTGTTARNKRLAEGRAKVVYDFLISKGVDAKQLTFNGLGDTKSPFPIQKANRSAVIN